jgi:hypothetical protein
MELTAYIPAAGYGLAGGTLAGATVAVLRRFFPYRYSLPIAAAVPCVGAVAAIYDLKHNSYRVNSDRNTLDPTEKTVVGLLVGGYVVSFLVVFKASSAWRQSLWLARRSYAATAKDARRQAITTRPRQ